MRDTSSSETSIPFFPRLIATGLFTGYVPWASGTAGSLAGILIYLIPGVEQPGILLPLTAAIFGAGVWSSRIVADIEGHRLTASAALAKKTFQPGQHFTADPSIVVIDEIVGVWVSLALLPKTVPAVLTAFVVFRVLDILKPEPARRCERLPNGWGIMLDDVIAGLYTNAICRVLLAIGGLVIPSLLHTP